MSRFAHGHFVILAGLACSACAPTIDTDEPVTEIPYTVAQYAPDSAAPCNSVLPFPTDLAKDPVTGRLNIPICPDDSESTIAVIRGLRTLDGYSVNTPVTATFSGDINGNTVDDGVKIFTLAGVPVAAPSEFVLSEDELMVKPTDPLSEGTTYVVVITTAVKDKKGKSVGSDQIFTFLKDASPLIDANGYSKYAALPDADANALEPLRVAYQDVFLLLKSKGIERSDVALAWTFTTQTGYEQMLGLSAMVGALGGAAATHHATFPLWTPDGADPVNEPGTDELHPLLDAAGVPTDNLCNLSWGQLTLQTLATDSGTFGVDDAGNPLHGTENADYLFTLPKWPTLDPALRTEGNLCTAAGVAVFAHGLGRCKNDALAIANTMAGAGWATLSVDGPRAGGRSITGLGDQDFDGCPDQPAVPELIAPHGTSTNPFAIRDQLREWGVELVQIIDLAKNSPQTLVAGLAADPTAPDHSVGLVGHSFGGIAGVLAAASSSSIDTVVVSAASGDLGTVFGPSVEASMPDAGPVEKAEAKAIFTWILEPADPLLAARMFPTSVPVLVQVVSGAGVPDAPLHAASTQDALWDALNPELTTQFSVPGPCEDSSAVVGALLKPCSAEAGSYLATGALQRQMAVFLAGGGEYVCSNDGTSTASTPPPPAGEPPACPSLLP